MQQINDHPKKGRYTQSEEDPQHPTTKWNNNNQLQQNNLTEQKGKNYTFIEKKMKKQQPIDYTPTHKTTK